MPDLKPNQAYKIVYVKVCMSNFLFLVPVPPYAKCDQVLCWIVVFEERVEV